MGYIINKNNISVNMRGPIELSGGHWIPETSSKWEPIYDWTGFVCLALIATFGLLIILKATDKRNPE
jgi:hypothetical protein